MITNEQLGRYFRLECSQEEAEEIGSYLAEHPEIAVEFLQQDENNDTGNEQGALPINSARIWDKIYRHTYSGRVVRSGFSALVAAASIAVIVGAGAYLFLTGNNKAVDKKEVSLPPVVFTSLENTTTVMTSFHLPDGSSVQLMPHSSLRFIKGFETNRRNIELQGGARFRVARDMHRPFTVYTDGLVTTALGTEFVIKAYATDKSIYVNLIEGKVSVEQQVGGESHEKIMKFLKPGDKLVYHKAAQSYAISEKMDHAVTYKAPAPKKQATVTEGEIWYMFNNQPLPEVLDKLQELYHQEISYDSNELKGMTFIGQLHKTDSLHKILQSIALLNDLALTKTNEGYILKK